MNYQDEFLRETGSLINCRFGQLFDRKDLFKKCGRIGISRTKLNDTIDLLSTYPRQFNWYTLRLKKRKKNLFLIVMITIILKFILKCVADLCFDRRNLSDDNTNINVVEPKFIDSNPVWPEIFRLYFHYCLSSIHC